MTDKATEPANGGRMSLSAYARRRGVSKQAVSKAVERERLKLSVIVIAGRPFIADADVADREWSENTDLSRAPGYVKERTSTPIVPSPAGKAIPALPPSPESPPSSAPASQQTLPEGAPVDQLDPDARWNLKDASSEEKKWKALLAQLEYKKLLGELVLAKDVEAAASSLFANVRTRLLAVPGKARAAAPHLTLSDVALLERVIREALEELSTMDPAAPAAADGAAA